MQFSTSVQLIAAIKRGDAKAAESLLMTAVKGDVFHREQKGSPNAVSLQHASPAPAVDYSSSGDTILPVSTVAATLTSTASTASTISPTTTIVAATSTAGKSQTQSTWLFERLLQAGMQAPLALDCEQKLVYTEGFSSERDFADCPPDEFNRAYLTSIGITVAGVQAQVLRLHSELHVQLAHSSLPVPSSPSAPHPSLPPATAVTTAAENRAAQGLSTELDDCFLDPVCPPDSATSSIFDHSLDPAFMGDNSQDPVYVE